MERIETKDTPKYLEKEIKLAGWVHSRRDHGKIIFIDLRDKSGLVQLVFAPENKIAYKEANSLSSEDVISVAGAVNKRPKGMENDKIKTGEIEVKVKNIEILSKTQILPFEIDKDTLKIDESLRMKYRYLDLRSQRMIKNLRLRHKVVTFFRKYLNKLGFIEVETPILTKSTPEGARDFLVPSRQQKGKFYALPQSPQQFKQLLMISGIEKYYQIARCLRDEDPRGDRQVEHTQLDMEMSFISQNEVMNLIEKMMIEMIKKVAPEKKITATPFPILSYKEAIEKYKTDRPDLRKDKKNPDELAFVWVKDFPFFTRDEKGDKKSEWTFTHNPFSNPMPEDKEKLLKGNNIEEIKTSQYDLVLNGLEIGGGSIRSHEPEILEAVFKILGYSKDEINDKFGHMLEAFKYGVPPHGGIAPGIDRIMMILAGEPNIREVIAFPKTGDGRDLMMNAPSEVSPEQLQELKIEIKNKD